MKIGLIILVIVTIALGVYEILNSVAFDENGKARTWNYNELSNRIMIEDNSFKNEQMDYFYKKYNINN